MSNIVKEKVEELCLERVDEKNIDAFKQRMRNPNFNTVLQEDDIKSIEVDVLKELLNNIYTSEDKEFVVKNCLLLSSIDKLFDLYFNKDGDERRIVLADILVKYIYGKESETENHPFLQLDNVYESMLEDVKITNYDMIHYIKIVQDDRAKQKFFEAVNEMFK